MDMSDYVLVYHLLPLLPLVPDLHSFARTCIRARWLARDPYLWREVSVSESRAAFSPLAFVASPHTSHVTKLRLVDVSCDTAARLVKACARTPGQLAHLKVVITPFTQCYGDIHDVTRALSLPQCGSHLASLSLSAAHFGSEKFLMSTAFTKLTKLSLTEQLAHIFPFESCAALERLKLGTRCRFEQDREPDAQFKHDCARALWTAACCCPLLRDLAIGEYHISALVRHDELLSRLERLRLIGRKGAGWDGMFGRLIEVGERMGSLTCLGMDARGTTGEEVASFVRSLPGSGTNLTKLCMLKPLYVTCKSAEELAVMCTNLRSLTAHNLTAEPARILRRVGWPGRRVGVVDVREGRHNPLYGFHGQ
jgi:hypothetical protein